MQQEDAMQARIRLPLDIAALGRVRAVPAPDLVLAIGAACLVLAVFFVLGAPAYRELERRARDAAVRGNAATLQLAAESFAAAHQGRYPVDPLELLPYLPGDAAPRNPWTGERSRFAGDAGDLTYRSPRGGRDYVIQAWGRGPDGRATLLETRQGRAPQDVRRDGVR